MPPSQLHILHVVGARPNFMKASPVIQGLSKHHEVRQTLVHTGQHYDAGMSDVFFRQLQMTRPDINLEVGSATHAVQTGMIMTRLEPVIMRRKPDLVLVYGDVNSTVAAALVCSKLLVPVGHVEAGLRSFDRTMPEEINRKLTDQVSDILFTPSEDGDENLLCEGIPRERIHLVGNVMIDTLVRLLPAASPTSILDKLGLTIDKTSQSEQERCSPGNLGRPRRSEFFGLVTLHRPSNVDDPTVLAAIMQALGDISASIPLLFPVHPRTLARIHTMRPQVSNSRVRLLEPLGYIEFLALEGAARFVITDSGGIQEETTYLGVPCLTVRKSTERPITVKMGTNILLGHDMDRLRTEVAAIIAGQTKRGQVPPLWDGKAAERITDIITEKFTGDGLVPCSWE